MNNVAKANALAKKRNENEFYTRYWNIQNEIENHDEYIEYFKGKRVCSPCNDYYGNFKRFFELNFDKLGLVEHTAVHYTGEVTLEHPLVPSKYFHMWRDETGVHKEDIQLKGNGDCLGQEVIEIMKEADIVCTNPPFGGGDNKLINLCISLKKKFLIIGCSNSGAKGTMINSFDKDWRYGYANKNSFYFRTTDLVILRKTGENKQNQLKMMDDIVAIDDNENPVWKESLCVKILCSWYTNIRNGYDNLDFVKSLMKNKYAEKIKNYPTIENVENAIAVLGDNCRGNVNEIPCDYDGLMLVPQTFIENNFDSRYFEVVSNGCAPKSIVKGARKETLDKYFEQSKCRVSENTTLAVYTNKNGIVKVAGANFGVYVKWKVKEREALKKELGL